LGTFLDDPEDEAHVPALQALCPDLHIERIDPRLGKLRSLQGLLKGQALSVAFYQRAGLHAWIRQTQARHGLDATVVFSGAMAQFATPLLPGVPMLVDFVDVDSIKWQQYAPEHRWPMSWLYAREGRCLLAYERAVAAQAQQAFFVTPKEAALFQQAAPEVAPRVGAICNGVDAAFFDPAAGAQPGAQASPFAAHEQPIVFTGAMDYWPNVDGVSWCVNEMLPAVQRACPAARFYIVGRNPTAQVKALAGPGVVVTGTVPDVRPYLRHAHAVVAPLRVARGIQNKVLEAMAMGQPVITVPGCAEAIGASEGQGLLQAATPDAFVAAMLRLLQGDALRRELGVQARAFVLRHFSWEAHLAALDAWLPSGATATLALQPPARGGHPLPGAIA
jgi:sugar transferase (PEP-CTERM/EpsH1 system associated)